MNYFTENKKHFSSSNKSEHLKGYIYFYEQSVTTTAWIHPTQNARQKLIHVAKNTDKIHILTNSLNLKWYAGNDAPRDTNDCLSNLSNDEDSDDNSEYAVSSCNEDYEFYYVLLYSSYGTYVFDTFRIYNNYSEIDTDMSTLETGGCSFMLLEICEQTYIQQDVQSSGLNTMNVYLLHCGPKQKHGVFLDILHNTKILKRLHSHISHIWR